jgi:hypothetical protein
MFTNVLGKRRIVLSMVAIGLFLFVVCFVADLVVKCI